MNWLLGIAAHGYQRPQETAFFPGFPLAVRSIGEIGGVDPLPARWGLSPRHARRLLQRLRERGPEGLVHGNGGRSPANRTPEELRQQILAWVEERYADFNGTHLAEILAEREGISIGRETLRSLLRDAHHRPKRKRRPKRRRSRDR